MKYFKTSRKTFKQIVVDNKTKLVPKKCYKDSLFIKYAQNQRIFKLHMSVLN
jgi:hypothetical protein